MTIPRKNSSFSILQCSTAILLGFNLFHLGFFPRFTHSFDTSECYLASFCLLRSGFCSKFVFIHSLFHSVSLFLTFHFPLHVPCATSMAANCNNFVGYFFILSQKKTEIVKIGSMMALKYSNLDRIFFSSSLLVPLWISDVKFLTSRNMEKKLENCPKNLNST